jgi:hypothetical protein
MAVKRVHQIIRENKPAILEMFVKSVEEHPDIANIPLSKKQRSDHHDIFLDDLVHKLKAETRTAPQEGKEEQKNMERVVSGRDTRFLNL